ncbi:MAG: response regulator [Desulfobacteraceae bacterium]|nr:response regulator [Desulfobacteraceae bacterium]
MNIIQEKYKVLVVDDEESILDVTEGFFQRKGHEVLTAENGKEAIRIIKKEKGIDCCFTDINMPEMDGLELAQELQKRDDGFPVVIMTGYPSIENTIDTLKNGVADFLIKPVNLEQMELTLNRVVRQRSLFVENLILKEEIERQEKLKKLNAELVTRIDDVNILNRIMEDFSSTDSSYDIFNKVVELGSEILKADNVVFHIWAEQNSSLVSVVSNDNSGDGTDFDDIKPFIKGVIEADAEPCLVSQGRARKDLPDGVLSLMVVPLKIRGKVFGSASAIISKGKKSFDEKDIYYMTFITRKAASAIENIALYENIYDNLFSTLYAFVAAVEARDRYTREHSTRVAKLAYKIGEQMKCSDEELNIINFAGYLHDVGKIGIRDDILLKPGKLNDQEYEKIKEHPVIGADIVGKLGLWDKEQVVIRHHHERYDGKGYPDGLKEKAIPKLSRILAVADVVDAISSDRAYRKRMEFDKMVAIIKMNAGSQFDPEVVKHFLKIADKKMLTEF